jgi:hypothetical protein
MLIVKATDFEWGTCLKNHLILRFGRSIRIWVELQPTRLDILPRIDTGVDPIGFAPQPFILIGNWHL